MKLLTYLEEGRFRTGILTVRPDSAEPVVLGIQDAVALLEAQAARVYWRTPWAGPWGVLTAPADMLDIVAHGRQAVIALEDLERTIWHYGRTVDGGWVDALLRDPEQIQWQPPLPEPPLYIFLSGNTQVMAHQRSPNPPWQVPAARLRPITAIIGHREPLFAHDGDTAASDMELGVVIGPVAQGVGADTAMDYVFGYTVCNDTSSPVFGQKTEPFGPLTGVRMGGVATGNKGADGCGPIGPVITTADEVGSPHDLTATARFNDRVRVRAHTGAYLYNVRDTVAHFAQLMTLPAGAIIGMGACGYDGHAVQGAWRHPERNVLAVEFERVGRLEHPISYLDDPARQGVGPQGRQSRYLARREQLGLGGADRPELAANDVPAATRSFWALSENVGSTPLHKLPAPYLYPASSLAGTADGADPAAPRPSSRGELRASGGDWAAARLPADASGRTRPLAGRWSYHLGHRYVARRLVPRRPHSGHCAVCCPSVPLPGRMQSDRSDHPHRWRQRPAGRRHDDPPGWGDACGAGARRGLRGLGRGGGCLDHGRYHPLAGRRGVAGAECRYPDYSRRRATRRRHDADRSH